MNKKIITALVFGFILLTGISYADSGETSASFLKIGVGARPAAMGEAYSGVGGDILSIYSNPAGLSSVEGWELSFTHAFWFADINYSNFAVGAPMLNGYLAVGGNGLFYGEIDKYKSDGTDAGDTYSPSDMAFSLSYARDDLIEDMSFGGTFKFINSNIDDETATAVAMDIGAMKQIGDVNTGLSVQNIGTEMKYRDEGDPLPFITRLGASYPFMVGDFDMLASAETNFSADVPFRINAGVNADYPVDDFILSLRLGLKSYAEGLDPLSHLTAGFGVSISNMKFDYAFASFEDLGMTHRISMSTRL